MNNKILLAIGIALCIIGFLKPNFNIYTPSNNPQTVINIEKPSDEKLLEITKNVVDILQKNNASSQDCCRLASLYQDMALLISLDGDQQLVRNTDEIRQSNKISGLMLKMNLNDKYPNLASAMNAVVVHSIGDDNIPLTNELRKKASNAFLALSWACMEGTK